jgi:glycosyltransferase involved in cell wall biosynthesis
MAAWGEAVMSATRALEGGWRGRQAPRIAARSQPLVSVNTVVRNAASALPRTLESVRDQSFGPLEHIVIDGASSDGTVELLQLHDDELAFWLSAPDGGIFDAMNKGVRHACGEWIAFLNAGDYYLTPTTIADVFAHDWHGADFIYGHTLFLGGDARGVVRSLDFSHLWKTMIFTHQSLFTRAAILRERPFDTGFRICADYDLIVESYYSGRRFAGVDMAIAAFDPGFSDSSRARMAWEKWQVMRRRRNDLAFHWFYAKLFLRRLGRDAARRLCRPRGR